MGFLLTYAINLERQRRKNDLNDNKFTECFKVRSNQKRHPPPSQRNFRFGDNRPAREFRIVNSSKLALRRVLLKKFTVHYNT